MTKEWTTGRALLCSATITLAGPALSADGLVAVNSVHPPKSTLDRFEAAAKERGLMVFARIDHAAGAQKVGNACAVSDRARWLCVGGRP